MSNILDDLFNWAAQEPLENQKTIQIAVVTTEVTRSNLVSCALGKLTYYGAAGNGMRQYPPYLFSGKDGLTQYFSNRTNVPFDKTQTDPLTVTITGHFALAATGDYPIRFQSSKWNFDFTIQPTFEPTTQILYALHDSLYITISLCGRQSDPGIR
jgi:hypothetical protein